MGESAKEIECEINFLKEFERTQFEKFNQEKQLADKCHRVACEALYKTKKKINYYLIVSISVYKLDVMTFFIFFSLEAIKNRSGSFVQVVKRITFTRRDKQMGFLVVTIKFMRP